MTSLFCSTVPINCVSAQIEAFTVAHRADENIEQKEKWRIVSSRVVLPVKIRILPSASTDLPPIAVLNSPIRLDLSSTARVGSTVVHLGSKDSLSRWYILISDVEHTRYFHVDIRSGQVMLIRPIDELMNTLPIVRLRMNVTQNWIDMETIEVSFSASSFSGDPFFLDLDYRSSGQYNVTRRSILQSRLLHNGVQKCILWYGNSTFSRGSSCSGLSLQDSLGGTNSIEGFVPYRFAFRLHPYCSFVGEQPRRETSLIGDLSLSE